MGAPGTGRSGAGGERTSSKAPMASGVRAQILQLIEQESLRPGDQLPTETELAARLTVSRATVREAFKLMEQDGLVNAVQGRGRFLTPLSSLRVERPITRYESTTEMLESLGYEVTNVVLDVAEVEADEHTAAALDIAVGDPLIRLVRLRLGNNDPMVFSIDLIVRQCLPGPISFRDWGVSVHSALAAHGRRIISSIARISATTLAPEYASRHDLEGLDPWLLIEETCMTRDGDRVLFALDYHRSSEIAFNVLRRR